MYVFRRGNKCVKKEPKLPFQRKRKRDHMSVTIQAMEDFATSLPEVSFSQGGNDFGTTIEVSHLEDDMGLN